MPQIMLECEELIFDALTLHQGIYTLPGWINVPVIHVIFFNDVALKHAHLKELIECHLAGRVKLDLDRKTNLSL
jgi:hypothetical protein